MPSLLDTNIYLFAMPSEDGAAFFESRFLPLVFQTYLSGVVVEELLALCARRIGADLHTFNRDDFELIRRHKPFSLKLLKQ